MDREFLFNYGVDEPKDVEWETELAVDIRAHKDALITKSHLRTNELDGISSNMNFSTQLRKMERHKT